LIKWRDLPVNIANTAFEPTRKRYIEKIKRNTDNALIFAALTTVGAPIEIQKRYGAGFRKLVITPFLTDLGLRSGFVNEDSLKTKLSKAR
jgi:hypothetical protein